MGFLGYFDVSIGHLDSTYSALCFGQIPGPTSPVLRFLKYLPIAIIFALILSSLVEGKAGQLPQVRWVDLVATIPTMMVAFRYKNLMGTVLFGIVLVALFRLLVA